MKSTKIIVDRAGVSKGYGFVTFETEQEAQRLQADVRISVISGSPACHSARRVASVILKFDFVYPQGECVVLRDRKLNIAPAIKKQVNIFHIPSIPSSVRLIL